MDILELIKKNFVFQRFIAFYIDLLIVTIIALFYLFFIDDNGPFLECDNYCLWNSFKVLKFQFIFYFLYFVIVEGIFRTSIGKIFFGFFIVNKGDNISITVYFLKIVLRVLAKLLTPFFGIINYFIYKKFLFWHEVVSGLSIVKKTIPPPPLAPE